MIVVFQVRATGSAEIVVTAGSSTDDNVVPADFLGYTIGRTSQKLLRQGYHLAFVTDKFFVFEKAQTSEDNASKMTPRITLFPKRTSKHRYAAKERGKRS